MSNLLTEVFFAPEEAEKLRVVENISLARLRELADAEREGRVVVLPIKADRIFYAIECDIDGELSVQQYVFDCGYMNTLISEWGKTAFATEAEAYGALAEKGDAT